MLKNCSLYSLVVSGISLVKLSAHVGEHYFQNTAGPKRKDKSIILDTDKCYSIYSGLCVHGPNI